MISLYITHTAKVLFIAHIIKKVKENTIHGHEHNNMKAHWWHRNKTLHILNLRIKMAVSD
jgi:hypothetical protein